MKIIEDDPTCAAWAPIAQTLTDIQGQGWASRDPSVSAADWSADQRQMYERVASAMQSAASETEALMRTTPHRVMRELYEQSIAYWRAYATAVPQYASDDDRKALVANGISTTVTWICEAVTYGSAAARSRLLTEGVTPEKVAPLGNPSNPEPFLETKSAQCTDWHQMVNKYRRDTSDWMQSTDPTLPASQWSPAQQEKFTAMMSVLSENGSQAQDIALRSENLVWLDFADLIATYRDAYVLAIGTYLPADNYLDSVATALMVSIDDACIAART